MSETDIDLSFKVRCGDEDCTHYGKPVDQKTGKCAGSPNPATSPKDIVRTLPSLKELHENSVNWSPKEHREYENLLDSYRMSVYRIRRLREEMEAEENE